MTSNLNPNLSNKFYSLKQQINKTCQMDESAIRRLNPQLSVQNQRAEYKKVQTDVNVMKNRVQLLRQQLQKEKQSIKKNKAMVKQTIQKKIEINKINQYKLKDDSSEIEKIQQLRQRNKSLRQSHNKELQNIQKAIYLVKLDDARQLKNISIQHKKKIQQMDRQFLSHQKERKKKIAEQSIKAKQRYMQYWKQKIGSLYLQQAQNVMEISQKKQDKKKQLEQLQLEEMKLLEEINKYHTQQVESKKQYLAALSLPVKDVAEAMGLSPEKNKNNNLTNRSRIDMSESRSLNNSMLGGVGELKKSIKLPNTNVNEAKLKIILKQLKKMQRSQTYTSR